MRPFTAGRRPRPLASSALDALVFIAAAALVLFGLVIANRMMLPVLQGSARAIDGDSLRQGDTEIRLYGIDAPEYLQTCREETGERWPCGREAAAYLSGLVWGKKVDCAARDVDRYGREVAICNAGSTSLNREMVRQGFAVAYRRLSLDYVSEEAGARAARRGIWRGSFEEPEKWRRHERFEGGDRGDGPPPED